MAILTGTTARRNAWIQWLDHCKGRNGTWVNILFYGKTIGGVPSPAVDAYRALETVLKATGYEAKSRWAYNFRGIGGASCTCGSYGECSLHGNGIAIDIDPVQNPYIRTSTFSWSKTKFTPTQIAVVKAILNTEGEQMWDWGGWWRTIKDYMHFELQVYPASCQVDWKTVKGYTGTPTIEGDDMLKMNQKAGAEGVDLQQFLNVAGFTDDAGAPLKYDGVIGPKTFQAYNKGLAYIGRSPNHEFISAWCVSHIAMRKGMAAGGGGGVTTAQLTTAINKHAGQKAGAKVHPHVHDEGQTGPAI